MCYTSATMWKTWKIVLIAAALAVAGWGCNRPQEFSKERVLFEARENGLIMDEQETAAMALAAQQTAVAGKNPTDIQPLLLADRRAWKAAALADVTGGGSFGLAHATFEKNTYKFFASLGNLPALRDGYVYEGWVVKRGEHMSVVRIGQAVQNGEAMVQVFESQTNLLDHDFFVLTLEPDDGDPAPAEHVLEGTFK